MLTQHLDQVGHRAERVVPMLVMNSTVFREVLLIWIPYLSIRILVLERIAVDQPAPPTCQGHPADVEHEIVRRSRRPRRRSSPSRCPEIGLRCRFRSVHPRGSCRPTVTSLEILLQQRMVLGPGRRSTMAHLDLALVTSSKPSSSTCLPAGVQRGQDLVVRRGRGVGHVGLVKRLSSTSRFEVLVPDVNHRALAAAPSGSCGWTGWRRPGSRTLSGSAAAAGPSSQASSSASSNFGAF